MTSMENDIGTAIMRLRSAFAKHGIPCPDVLAYSDSRKAYEALVPLRRSLGPAHWSMNAEAVAFGEVCLAGMTVQFEAQHVERPGTGLELDDGVSGRVFFEGGKT